MRLVSIETDAGPPPRCCATGTCTRSRGTPHTGRAAGGRADRRPEGTARAAARGRPRSCRRWRGPGKLVCIGQNYHAHCEEQGKEAPELPTFFAKFANALVPSGATVALPPWSRVDYEAEVAFVIGRRAKDVSEDDALDHVAGYMLLNDLSARDYQFKTPQWMPGKVFDGSAPCGPALVTPDEAGAARRDRVRAAR